MASAKAVANFFVEQSILEGLPVTQLKLQKLVYYSYAWYIASQHQELFREDIEAWRHGPVIRSVWQEFKRFGSSVITEVATQIEGLGVNAKFIVPRVETELRGYLMNVWNTYKNYSAIQLSNMTHAADEPWVRIRPLADSDDDHPVIPPNLISALFERKLQMQTA